MNVLMFPPTHGSGLAVQFRETVTALRAQGVEVSLAPEAAPESRPDLAHLFDAPDILTSLASLARARALGVPIVITPIYWNPDRFYDEGLPAADPPEGPGAGLECERRVAARAVERAAQALVYRHAAVLIAMSPSEAALLARDFRVAPERIALATDGLDASLARATPDAFVAAQGVRDFVLCAARVEIRKNQLTLVTALRDEALTLVCIGETLSPAYRRRCEDAAAGGALRLVFLPALAPAQLASAYAAARVHALASWYDCAPFTPLEAALAGCAVAMSSESGARDYLGDDAAYFDPGDPADARRAILAVWSGRPSPTLRERLARECTWTRSAEQTRAAYARAESLGNPDEASYAEELEAVTLALARLADIQARAHAALWRDKVALEETAQAYASGRVMRVLNALRRGGSA